MENDDSKNISLILAKNHTSIKVFKLQYEDQNVNNNIDYQKWKKIMLKEYGNNSMEFKCNEDKILFYSKYNDCLNDYYYKSKCPICKNYICYFCSFNDNYMYNKCWIKSSFYKSIFFSAPQSVNEKFEKFNLTFLVPGLNVIIIIMFFFYSFYIDLLKEKAKSNNIREEYIGHIKDKEYILNYIFIVSIGIFITISYLIIFSYLIVLLIIISIPFKFVPLKYYIGLLDSF